MNKLKQKEQRFTKEEKLVLFRSLRLIVHKINEPDKIKIEFGLYSDLDKIIGELE